MTNMGRAFAGSGVTGDDYSAAFYNPAGLSLYKNKAVQLGLTYVGIASEFKGDSTFTASLAALSATDGSAMGRISSFVPSAYYVSPVNDKLTWGLSFGVPFGLGTKYDKDSFVKYYAVESNLMVLELLASASYKVTDKLSFAVGLGMQEVSAKLSQISPATSLVTEIEGDDYKPAYNLGLMYEINANNRVGLAFRSSVAFELEGEQDSATDITADLNTPEVVTFTSYSKLNEKIALTSIIKWTNWSKFKTLGVYETDGTIVSVVDESWQDTWMAGLGLDYYVNPEWTLRTGVAYDETPIKSEAYRTARIPDNDRIFLSLGASYMPRNTAWQVDFGYTAFLIKDSDIDSTHNVGGTSITQNLDGTYSSSGIASLVGVQASYKF
jgi:long-chain fatty acid transport protein